MPEYKQNRFDSLLRVFHPLQSSGRWTDPCCIVVLPFVICIRPARRVVSILILQLGSWRFHHDVVRLQMRENLGIILEMRFANLEALRDVDAIEAAMAASLAGAGSKTSGNVLSGDGSGAGKVGGGSRRGVGGSDSGGGGLARQSARQLRATAFDPSGPPVDMRHVIAGMKLTADQKTAFAKVCAAAARPEVSMSSL